MILSGSSPLRERLMALTPPTRLSTTPPMAKPSMVFLRRPSSSPSSPSASRYSVTGLLSDGKASIRLLSLSSCAWNIVKSATAPAVAAPLRLRTRLPALLSLLSLPTLLNCPATGMKPVRNCVMPSVIVPPKRLERPRKRVS